MDTQGRHHETYRSVQRALFTQVGLLLLSQLAIASPESVVVTIPSPSFNDSGTLTEGSAVVCRREGVSFSSAVGFDHGAMGTYGTYSPTSLAGGQSVKGIFDVFSVGFCRGLVADGAKLFISGFSSNPGTLWLISVTCNEVTLSQASSVFVYNGLTAEWAWPSQFGFGGHDAQVSCTITHN